MKGKRILLVEDDSTAAKALKDFFEDSGLEVLWAADGEMAVSLFKRESPQLVVLDIILPKKDGFEVISEIRKIDYNVPVILMSGTELSDRKQIKGYELGAVNYLRKPVIPQIVLAQIKTLLEPPKQSPEYVIGGHTISLSNQILKVDGDIIELREKESFVIGILLKQHDEVISRKYLISTIWSDNNPNGNGVLDNTISRLKKLLEPYRGIKIKSIYGNGYILRT